MLGVCCVDDVLFGTSIAAAFERLSPTVVPEACSLTLFDTVALRLSVRVFLSTPWFLRVVVASGGRQQCAQHIMFLKGPSVASFFFGLLTVWFQQSVGAGGNGNLVKFEPLCTMHQASHGTGALCPMVVADWTSDTSL